MDKHRLPGRALDQRADRRSLMSDQEVSLQEIPLHQRLRVLVYPSAVDVSSSALRFLSAKLRRHRRELGTRWRRLSAGRRALLALAHLRNAHPYAQLAAAYGIATTTGYRYITEAVEVLAALAPTLAEAVRTASTKAFVLLDGTLLPIDRIAADRPFYSGKHKRHGMNVQLLADPSGQLLWASPALPGAVHDARAARERGVIGALAEAGITCWADKGYRGAGGTVRVPCWGRWETRMSGPLLGVGGLLAPAGWAGCGLFHGPSVVPIADRGRLPHRRARGNLCRPE